DHAPVYPPRFPRCTAVSRTTSPASNRVLITIPPPAPNQAAPAETRIVSLSLDELRHARGRRRGHGHLVLDANMHVAVTASIPKPQLLLTRSRIRAMWERCVGQRIA